MKVTQGFSIVELLIAMAIGAFLLGIGATQLQNITRHFASAEAEDQTRIAVSQAAELFKKYFETKWQGGVFECTDPPTIGQDAYCVLQSDCQAMPAADQYDLCKTMAIIRGDPADPTTNPDRIRIQTKCLKAQMTTQGKGTFAKSKCDLQCPTGEFPAVIFEKTPLVGATQVVSFPGGVGSMNQRSIKRLDEMRGMELCITKTAGTTVVVNLQGYFLNMGRINTMDVSMGLPERTTNNNNLQILP